MDKKRMPPAPKDQRSTKGTGSDPDAKIDDPVSQDPKNIDQTGDRGNVRQNTSNQQDKR
jgi:hypothetical protein